MKLTDDQVRLLDMLTNGGYALSQFGWLWRDGFRYEHVNHSVWRPMKKSGLLAQDGQGWIVAAELGRHVKQHD